MRWFLLVVALALVLGGVALTGIVDSSNFTVSSLQVVEDGSNESPLVYDATLTDATIAPDDSAAIRVSVTNEGSEPVTVESGPLPPFGLLTASPAESGVHGLVAKSELVAARQDGLVLWRDAYAESNEVTLDEDGGSVAAKEYQTTIRPGETITQTFQIRSNATGLTRGTYQIRHSQSWDEGTHLTDPSDTRFVVTFEVHRENETR